MKRLLFPSHTNQQNSGGLFTVISILAFCFVLLFPAGPATAAPGQDGRRVLKARDVDSQGSISDEYARLAEQKRLESIQRLKELLSRGVEGDTKAEMMLRLADLYFQQGRFLLFQEMEAFDKIYEDCFNDENCQTEMLQADNSRSNNWQEKSIKLYEAILRNYPRYRRADQATYFLGAALQDLERRKEGVEAFKKLAKLYPQSDYIADAYVQIGEYYFDTGNAYGALRAYLKATAYRDSEKYPFALYKLAWCYYNVGDYGKSIDTMKAVVTYSMQQQTDAGTMGQQLQTEALKDLVRFFADAGEIDEAYEYFNKLGKKDLIRSMLKRLATMYFEQGKFDQAIETYRRLILEDPQSKSNPEYQNEIINAYRKVGQRERVLEEIDRLRREYGETSAWARANASDSKALKEAVRRIEESLRRVALEYHNKARKYEKIRNPDAGKVRLLAEQAYATYLGDFPNTEHVYEMRYSYAELLYKLKRYDNAYEQYMGVVKTDPKGKHSEFCASSAIFSAEEMVKQEGGTIVGSGKVSDPKNREPQPLTPWEQRLTDACHQYATLYPTNKKVRNIIFKSAYLLYNKFRLEEAADQFKVVIQMDPTSREAEQAANLILDSFVVNEDWENLKANAKFYFDQERLGSKKFKKDVYTIYENSSFKLIEINFEKNEDYGQAADAFVAFYNEFPDSKAGAKALNNASVYYYKVDRVDDSMKVRHILVEDPKFGAKTKYFYDQISALGYDYETVADFERASHYYEKLWALYPERRKTIEDESPELLGALDAQAGDAIYSAAVFRNALIDWQDAIDNYTQFVAAFPSDSRVTDIRLTIPRIYEDNEKWAKAANAYHSFYASNPPSDINPETEFFARMHYARALKAQGQTTKATEVYTNTIAAFNKLVKTNSEKGSHTEVAAEMMFDIAKPRIAEYTDLQIKGAGPGATRKQEDEAFAKSVKAKASTLREVEKIYSNIINTGAGEWGVAALVTLGKAYENMGNTLDTGDMPFYLTEEQQYEYRLTLEDRVYMQQEKAVTAYKLALEKSYDLTLYNDNTAFATRRLGELRPEEFSGLEEEILDPGYVSRERRQFDFQPEM